MTTAEYVLLGLFFGAATGWVLEVLQHHRDRWRACAFELRGPSKLIRLAKGDTLALHDKDGTTVAVVEADGEVRIYLGGRGE